MDLQLTDKIAVVTGSSRGLGAASAAALVQEGCRVAICARREVQLADAAVALRQLTGSPDRVLPIVADVATTAGVEKVIGETVAAFGGLDILVNNFGLGSRSTIGDTTDE